MNTDMNVSTALSSMVGQTTGDAVALSVLKKAIETQAQSAAALINSVSQPQSAANLPPNLGQNINTTA
jgi:hypothetical protein